MRNLLIMLLCLACLSPAYAFEYAQLKMKISGQINDNRYFLCVPNVGCMSILAGNKGKLFPLSPGSISSMAAIDMTTQSLHPQSLPASCQVSVKENQIVTISGKLKKDATNRIYLSQLQCMVS